ncbi:hypothetical protein Tco_0255100 [Tanacetum coccineum]
MSFSKRSDGSPVCYTKALDSLKYWNDNFFWVDAFACPTSFKWYTNKTVFKDPPPKPTEFSADAVAILVSHRAPFRKFSEPFLCLVGMSRNSTIDEDTYPRFLYDDDEEMDLFSFIHHADLTKVKIAEREGAEGEMKLLESTVGHVVSLLPVPPRPARTKSELEASVDELFDEGDNTEQGDSTVGGGHGAKIEPVTAVEDTVAENVTMERPKRQCKKRPAVTDASGPSHPPKKLREDHGTSSGISLGSKSLSILKELLSSSILNIEVGVTAAATLPLITSSISATPECEGGDPIDSVIGPNVRIVGPAQRFVISSDSSHHSTTNAFGAEVDSIIRSDVLPLLVTEAVITSHAAPVRLTETVRPDVAGPSYSVKQGLSMGSQELNTETLHQIREMDYHHLFTQFNMGTTRQACLNAEVRMRTEYCLSERRRLESKCEKQYDLLKAKDSEIENLKAQLLLKEAEAAEVARLHIQVSAVEAAEKVHADELNALKQKSVALEDESDSLNGKITELQSSLSAKDLELKDVNGTVHSLETTCSCLRDQVSGYEQLKEQIKEFQDAQINIVNDKVAKLDADLLEMALHMEEKFYPHLLTTISGRRWLLTHGLKLVVVKCLNSPEYLAALGAAISCAIEKGMQSGLRAGIDHGKEDRSLADVVAYAKVDFNSALQRFCEVDFPLLAELSSHKDASVEDIMNLLCLETPLLMLLE